MNLRRLNDEGVRDFVAYLTQLKNEPGLQAPMYLLQDPTRSEPVAEVVVPKVSFATRFAAAAALDALLTAAALTSPERDAKLWAWLALFYFDQLCPLKAGVRTVGEHARYVPLIDVARRYYRHMLLGPVVLYRTHLDRPERLRSLLTNPISVATSETYRLFIENSSLITCKSVVDLATTLYFDFGENKMKRGVGSKDAGGCRRLIDYLQQIDCTFDLEVIPEKRLIAMLPIEFKKYIPLQSDFINHSSLKITSR